MSEKVKNKIAVVNGEGCWSHVGRIIGTQALSLGDGCESTDVMEGLRQSVRLAGILIRETAGGVFVLAAMAEIIVTEE
ncbi:hypothetical protein KIN20_012729 [Parelaphostrongylus tenuis]|uniref:Peptidase M12A domain-containing protein n=1 Tax=Parelaphostrongylus tenuis TaxID=148309 RepID=A0AAD5MB17_PARTN|nr:hypothetical protein KIN20_012729 [Parelaphostrongylus tenuis]